MHTDKRLPSLHRLRAEPRWATARLSDKCQGKIAGVLERAPPALLRPPRLRPPLLRPPALLCCTGAGGANTCRLPCRRPRPPAAHVQHVRLAARAGAPQLRCPSGASPPEAAAAHLEHGRAPGLGSRCGPRILANGRPAALLLAVPSRPPPRRAGRKQEQRGGSAMSGCPQDCRAQSWRALRRRPRRQDPSARRQTSRVTRRPRRPRAAARCGAASRSGAAGPQSAGS